MRRMIRRLGRRAIRVKTLRARPWRGARRGARRPRRRRDRSAARGTEKRSTLPLQLHRERAAQERPGAVEAGLDGDLVETQARRGFVGGQPLDVAQHEHPSKGVGQGRHGRFDLRGQLERVGALLGIGPRSPQRFRHEILPVCEVLDPRHPAGLPDPAECLMNRDAGEPRGEPGAVRELLEVQIGVDVGLLDDVLGLALVVEDRSGDAVEALVVAPHQHLEARGVPLADCAHELLVRHPHVHRALHHWSRDRAKKFPDELVVTF